MNPERWRQVDRVLQSVLERPPDEWAAFLDRACAGDEGLKGEVRSLLSLYDEAGSFIDRPALEEEAGLLTVGQNRAIVGEVFGNYKVVEHLGAGGMGEVYLAADTRNERRAALKLLPPYFTTDEQRVRRFQQEARAVLALNHPNIVTIYEIGQADAAPFIASELIEGENLRATLKRGRLGIGEALEIAIQVAGALAYAHEHGVVHRDIKPENIMQRPDGYVKVLDFGIAKLTERKREGMEDSLEAPTRAKVLTSPGMLMGTAHYMSPEQARGKEVDARTDVWSLGVVLYEMVTGTRPFDGETTSDVVSLILQRDPLPLPQHLPDAPAELERIIRKALNKSLDERYQTAKDFLADLKQFKRQYEQDAEAERLQPPRGVTVRRAGGGNDADAATVVGEAAATAGGVEKRTASSAEYLIGEIKQHKKGAALVVAVAVVAIAALVFGLYRLTGQNRTPVETSARDAAPAVTSAPGGPAKGIKTLAVLPFKPLSGKSQDQILEIGMTDALITKLSNVRQIVVRPTSAVLKYAELAQDSLAAGREQGVDSVLEGKIQKVGDRVRVTVQLLRVDSGTPLWADTFDGKFTDIFAVQDSISERVAAALQLELTGEERGGLAKRYTENPEAYQLFLKGRHVWGQFTPESHRMAIKYFEQAIALDPNYALAYTGLSETYSAAGSNSWLPPREAMPKAKQAALKAIEIDDTLGEAHTALGAIALFYEWDWDTAERELRRAVILNPSYANPHQLYSYYLTTRGRFDEAIYEAEQAHKIDPLSPKMYGGLADAYQNARNYDRAIELYREALEIDPGFAGNHAGLGATYEMKGMYEEAIAEYQRAVSLAGRIPIALSALGHAYAMAGKRSEALGILDELKEMSRREPVSPYDFAVLYRGLGDRDRMFEQLDKAFEERSSRLIWLKVEPFFDPFRSDPRFQEMLQRMKL
ncbi:MAG TPA: protein kinase [Pyrinomonadaceae bacterium]